MPERNFHLKLQVLEKYKKELCEKVKFSDVSHHLISSGSFTKEDCFEICSLPSTQQMKRCYEKLLQGFETPETPNRDKKFDTWTILLRALTAEHSGLTCKFDSELQKLSKKEKPRRLTKDDIGVPMHFKHLQHIGQSPLRRFLSLRSNSSVSSVDENDPDVKSFLVQAGVTDKHLKQRNTRKVIFDFIEKKGGIEAIRKEIRSSTGSSSPMSSISSPGFRDSFTETPLSSPGQVFVSEDDSSLSSTFS